MSRCLYGTQSLFSTFLYSSEIPSVLLHKLPPVYRLDCLLVSGIDFSCRYRRSLLHSIEKILRRSTMLLLLTSGDSYIEEFTIPGASLPLDS